MNKFVINADLAKQHLSNICFRFEDMDAKYAEKWLALVQLNIENMKEILEKNMELWEEINEESEGEETDAGAEEEDCKEKT